MDSGSLRLHRPSVRNGGRQSRWKADYRRSGPWKNCTQPWKECGGVPRHSLRRASRGQAQVPPSAAEETMGRNVRRHIWIYWMPSGRCTELLRLNIKKHKIFFCNTYCSATQLLTAKFFGKLFFVRRTKKLGRVCATGMGKPQYRVKTKSNFFARRNSVGHVKTYHHHDHDNSAGTRSLRCPDWRTERLRQFARRRRQ